MKGFFRLLKSHQDHAATSIIEAPSLQTLVQTSSPLDFVWSNFANDELEVRRTQDQHAWCKSNVSAPIPYSLTHKKATNPQSMHVLCNLLSKHFTARHLSKPQWEVCLCKTSEMRARVSGRVNAAGDSAGSFPGSIPFCWPGVEWCRQPRLEPEHCRRKHADRNPQDELYLRLASDPNKTPLLR